MTQLSPTEQEKLNEFQVITNFPESDYDKVVKLFQNNYWNLEIALSKFFDGHLDQEASRELPINPQSAPIQPPLQSNLNNFGFVTEQEGTFSDDFVNFHSTAPKLPLVKPITSKWRSAGLGQLDPNTKQGLRNDSSTLSHFGNFFESPFLFILLLLPRTITLFLTYIGTFFSWLVPVSSDYKDSVPVIPTLSHFDFSETFNKITHEENLITYHKGEFNDAYMEAKTDFKFLILILLGEEGSATSDTFIKKVLNNQRVSSLINGNSDDYITYIANVNEPQGHEIAKSLNVKAAPAVYFMGNVANGPSMVASMSLIAKIPTRSVNSFVARINLETVKYKPELIVKRFEKSELDYSRQIKEAQDRAYEESLENDRMKELAKLEKIRQQEKERERLEFQKENKLRFIKSLKKKFEGLTNYEWVKGEFITIRFQLPRTGEKVTQKFPFNFTTNDIYGFVDLQLHLKSDEFALDIDDNEEVHKDYKHVFEFDLFSAMPRFSVPEEKLDIKSVKELWPNSSLMVEYKLVDEVDEE